MDIHPACLVRQSRGFVCYTIALNVGLPRGVRTAGPHPGVTPLQEEPVANGFALDSGDGAFHTRSGRAARCHCGHPCQAGAPHGAGPWCSIALLTVVRAALLWEGEEGRAFLAWCKRGASLHGPHLSPVLHMVQPCGISDAVAVLARGGAHMAPGTALFPLLCAS